MLEVSFALVASKKKGREKAAGVDHREVVTMDWFWITFSKKNIHAFYGRNWRLIMKVLFWPENLNKKLPEIRNTLKNLQNKGELVEKSHHFKKKNFTLQEWCGSADTPHRVDLSNLAGWSLTAKAPALAPAERTTLEGPCQHFFRGEVRSVMESGSQSTILIFQSVFGKRTPTP